MALGNLLPDDAGLPVPQYVASTEDGFGYLKGSGGALWMQGDIAHDVADGSSRPMKIGGIASTTEPVAVGELDRVNAWFSPHGRLHVSGDNTSGTADHGSPDTGYPVKIGGKAVDPASLPADVDAGDRVNTLHDLKGRIIALLDLALPAGSNLIGKVGVATLDQYTPIDVDTDGTTNILNALPVTWRKASSGGVEFGTASNPVVVDSELPAAAALADGAANPTTPTVGAAQLLWGKVASTWERQHSNHYDTIMSVAARTADYQSGEQVNRNGRYLTVNIVASSPVDTPSVVFTIQGKHAGGGWYTLLASAAVTGAGTTTMYVGPGLAETANVSTNKPLPRTWRLISTHADADSITYGAYADVGV
jgi:hypothetical protein